MEIASEYDVDYAYGATGRLSTLTSGADVFTYSYLANSNLLSGVSYPNSISGTKSYEAHRDLLTQVAHGSGLSAYGYANDAIGRRTSMGKSGTAFSQTDSIAYGYNARSEVTSAAATTETLYNYAYSFDNIGNRITSSERGISSAYTSNNLNQYTAIDITTPTYDYDGNMTTDGMGWAYTWNAENRIIAKTSGGTTIEYKYDYAGRRVEEKVTASGTVVSQIYFVYDGWNKIEELNALDSNAVLKKYIWGLDLAGSLSATGSVGALLSETNTNGTFYATYDANGNVSEYLSSAGAIAAHYEYSPFGQTTLQNGASADSFRFRFSTKPACFYNGDYDYTLRDYSPSLGRWRSRDPIGEKGGWLLYGIMKNSMINNIDYLGNEPKPIVNSKGKIVGMLDKSWINCIGYATRQDGGLQPIYEGGGKQGTSLHELFSALGYQCTSGITSAKCKAHCNCEDYVMLYVYVMKNLNGRVEADEVKRLKKKYPNPVFDQKILNDESNVDFHGLRGEPDGTYTFQGHLATKGGPHDKIERFSPIPGKEDYFEDSQLLDKFCCCKK